jgi:hypothetical protein
MKRRKLLAVLIGLLGLVLVVATGAFTVWHRSNAITRETSDRLRAGMGWVEVEAILGPPGDYTSGPTENDDSLSDWGRQHTLRSERDNVEPNAYQLKWEFDTMDVWVRVSKDGTITAISPLATKKVEQGPLDNLGWRIGRRWEKWFPE